MAANRDPAQFSDPDRFIVDRVPTEVRKHMTFGKGPHACIGAALARAEVRIGLSTLFRRLPGLTVDLDRAPVRARNFPNNGYNELYLRWDPTLVLPTDPTA